MNREKKRARIIEIGTIERKPNRNWLISGWQVSWDHLSVDQQRETAVLTQEPGTGRWLFCGWRFDELADMQAIAHLLPYGDLPQ